MMSATCCEAVGAEEVRGASGEKRRERILALDAAVGGVVAAAGTERDRPVL